MMSKAEDSDINLIAAQADYIAELEKTLKEIYELIKTCEPYDISKAMNLIEVVVNMDGEILIPEERPDADSNEARY
jgi:hypothetical protein